MAKRTILIIEDESMIAEAMADIISILGHRAIWFESGPEALLAAERDPFDLAIVDLELPAMPGIEVAEELVRIQPEIRVVYSTGYSEQEESIDHSLPYVAGIIHKPFEISDLQHAIEKALGNT